MHPAFVHVLPVLHKAGPVLCTGISLHTDHLQRGLVHKGEETICGGLHCFLCRAFPLPEFPQKEKREPKNKPNQ